ncbi:hypothetical protein HY994_02630 [Candidatus Micrarchaeota archaeon]|nr:hypothetical protein [Candidatus Micrarchaeota archaeon]
MEKQIPRTKARPEKEKWNVAIYHSILPGISQDHHYFQFHIGPMNRFEKMARIEDDYSLNYVPTGSLERIHEMQVPKRLEKELVDLLKKQKNKNRSFYLGHIRFALHHDLKSKPHTRWKIQEGIKPSGNWKIAQAVQFYPKGEPEQQIDSWNTIDGIDENEPISGKKAMPYFGTWLEKACYQWLGLNHGATHVVASGDQSDDRLKQWTRLGLEIDVVYPIHHVLNCQERLLEEKKTKKR